MATRTAGETVEFTARYQEKMYLIGDSSERNTGFRRVEFHGGYYETDDPELIDWLTNHPDFGNEIFRSADPGAFVPVDASTKVVGTVATTKSNRDLRLSAKRGASKPPVAENVVEADPAED